MDYPFSYLPHENDFLCPFCQMDVQCQDREPSPVLPQKIVNPLDRALINKFFASKRLNSIST